jgi:DNA-binding MarR family transcriptional regulator
VEALAKLRPDLDTWPYRIYASAAELTRQLSDALQPTFEQAGIKGGDYEILSHLRRSGSPYESSPTELSQAVHLTTATTTRRLDRLEVQGLVRRLPHGSDRRAVIVQLTDSGLALADMLLEQILARITHILEPVREQTAIFEAIVRNVLDGVRTKPPKP